MLNCQRAQAAFVYMRLWRKIRNKRFGSATFLRSVDVGNFWQISLSRYNWTGSSVCKTCLRNWKLWISWTKRHSPESQQNWIYSSKNFSWFWIRTFWWGWIFCWARATICGICHHPTLSVWKITVEWIAQEKFNACSFDSDYKAMHEFQILSFFSWAIIFNLSPCIFMTNVFCQMNSKQLYKTTMMHSIVKH